MERGKKIKKNFRNYNFGLGTKKCWVEDAVKGIEIGDQNSHTSNYRDWNNVRRSYYRRRQIGNPGLENPFDLPRNSQITKMGVLRNTFSKEIGDAHR